MSSEKTFQKKNNMNKSDLDHKGEGEVEQFEN